MWTLLEIEHPQTYHLFNDCVHDTLVEVVCHGTTPADNKDDTAQKDRVNLAENNIFSVLLNPDEGDIREIQKGTTVFLQ